MRVKPSIFIGLVRQAGMWLDSEKHLGALLIFYEINGKRGRFLTFNIFYIFF